MNTKFTLASIVTAIFVGLTIFFAACNKDDMNAVVEYRGQVVYINTTTPFPDLTIKVTNGQDTHCQTQTDAGGLFSLKVRVNEIDGNYYLLAGDSTCIPKKVALSAYGQAEVDLGVIEVEGPTLPTVVTNKEVTVTAESATLGGKVETDGRLFVTARGVCYGETQEPTIEGSHTTDGTGIGEYTSNPKNLKHNTIYYARAYATNRLGTAYGEQVKFTTEEGVPIVTTDSVYRITAHAAKCKGHVDSDGGFVVTKRGTCWSKKPDPTTDDDCTDDGSGIGEFTSSLSNLLENTTYYIRTYATNSTATVYGEQIIVTTLDGLAVVKTDSVTAVTATGFTAHGTVVSDCDIPVTARGFCYATTQFPTIEDEHTTSGKGLGSYRSNISKLEYGTTYYIRAYATNETETTYGEQMTIKTLSGLPSVTTGQVANISAVKATCGGNVTSDGTLTVTARGVCYSTEQTPTIEGTHTIDGKGIGEFTSNLKDLTDKTTYYVRAYATTDAGTAYGEQRSFKTENGVPVVELTTIGEPTANSVTCSGKVTGDGGVTVTERGFCYSLTQYPTNTSDHIAIGNGMGEFSGSLTELAINTTYYVRAYAINSLGIGYSEQKKFTTKNGLATVTTSTASSTATTIMTGGNVSDNGGYAVTERGICYSSSNTEPTVTDGKVMSGKGNGAFNLTINGLSAGTTYYVRAYATNANGTAYGNSVSIQTKSGAASVSLSGVSNISALTASASVTVTDAGSATLQSCGICWSTNPNPTTSDNKTLASGNQLNTAYQCNMSELKPNTTYYIRAYATTDITTTYSEQKTFTTKDGAATVVLGTITNITALTASTTVTVTDAAGSTLQSCGICWSTNPNPTTSDNKTLASGNQLNTVYQCNMPELKPNTTYYVRGYAITDITTAYSTQVSFKTKDGLPTISTAATTATSTTITSGGTISNDGGYSIIARGVCYSTKNSNPTIADNYTTAGIGTGTFSTTITNVSVSTTYYVRAYATNSIGTAYGNVIIVTTGKGLPSVTTTAIGENVTENTAISGGQVTDDGGYSVTMRGVCWSTLPYPTIADNKTNNGSGTGYYSSTITGINLTVANTYYARAYATNKNGTSYGEQVLVSKENLDYKNLPSIEYGGYIYRLYPDMGAMTWKEANTACQNLVYGGYDDWELPATKDLLVHIMTVHTNGWYTEDGSPFEYVDQSRSAPKTPASARYWTADDSHYYYCCYHSSYKTVDGYETYYHYVWYDWLHNTFGVSYRVRPVRKYIANQ